MSRSTAIIENISLAASSVLVIGENDYFEVLTRLMELMIDILDLLDLQAGAHLLCEALWLLAWIVQRGLNSKRVSIFAIL